MKQFIFFIILLSFTACQELANLEPSQTETYVKFFGDFGDNYGVNLKETPEGDFVLLGYNEIVVENVRQWKSYLIKTDSYGNAITSFGQNGVLIIDGVKAKDLSINDTGYYVVADSINDVTGTSVMAIVNATTGGSLGTPYYINSSSLGSPGSDIRSSAIFSDSDMVICLGFQTIGNSNDLFYLQYTFSTNQVDWIERIDDKSYQPGRSLIQNKADLKYNWVASTTTTEGRGFKGGADEPQSADIPLPVTTAVDLDANINNFNLGGIGNTDDQMIFYEMDPAGGQLSVVGQNDLGSGTALSIAEAPDGGYVILGTENDNFVLFRSDYNGNVDTDLKPFTFSKTIDWVSRESVGAAIGTSDGGHAIFGGSIAGGRSMMVLIKTDSKGNL